MLKFCLVVVYIVLSLGITRLYLPFLGKMFLKVFTAKIALRVSTKAKPFSPSSKDRLSFKQQFGFNEDV